MEVDSYGLFTRLPKSVRHKIYQLAIHKRRVEVDFKGKRRVAHCSSPIFELSKTIRSDALQILGEKGTRFGLAIMNVETAEKIFHKRDLLPLEIQITRFRPFLLGIRVLRRYETENTSRGDRPWKTLANAMVICPLEGIRVCCPAVREVELNKPFSLWYRQKFIVIAIYNDFINLRDSQQAMYAGANRDEVWLHAEDYTVTVRGHFLSANGGLGGVLQGGTTFPRDGLWTDSLREKFGTVEEVDTRQTI